MVGNVATGGVENVPFLPFARPHPHFCAFQKLSTPLRMHCTGALIREAQRQAQRYRDPTPGPKHCWSHTLGFQFLTSAAHGLLALHKIEAESVARVRTSISACAR